MYVMAIRSLKNYQVFLAISEIDSRLQSFYLRSEGFGGILQAVHAYAGIGLQYAFHTRPRPISVTTFQLIFIHHPTTPR
jgi:hypothetical protein